MGDVSSPHAPAPAPVAPGDVLAGKYCVEQVLGVGGMGVVVAALHMQLGQRVALKFLLPAGMANPQVVARFEREARAAAQLRSEHVARVIDVGRLEDGSGGAPYIVMELLKGQDLGDLLHERGPLPEHDAVDFLMQACEAVAEAHSVGIVHRDLKPKNLFVTNRVDGSPLIKVLDFGISKVTGDSDLNLTGTAEIIGSPNYMSPEQLRSSRDVDPRSDIWSLGAILYELLGGRVPFVAETLTELCSRVLTEPPRPLEELRPEVHGELRRVIGKCLEKRADDRFQTVGELAMALAPFASPLGSALASRVAVVAGSTRSLPAPSPSSRVVGLGGSTSVSWDATELATTAQRPKRALALGAAFGAALVAVAAGVVFVLAPKPPAPTTSAATTPPAQATTVASPPTSQAPVVTTPPAAAATPDAAVETPPPPPTPQVASASSQAPPVAPGGRRPNARPKSGRPNAANDDLPTDRK